MFPPRPHRRTARGNRYVLEWIEGIRWGRGFDTVSADRSAGVDEERLEGIALILRAIDVTIVDVEAREDADSREQVATLRYIRERWQEKAQEEAARG